MQYKTTDSQPVKPQYAKTRQSSTTFFRRPQFSVRHTPKAHIIFCETHPHQGFEIYDIVPWRAIPNQWQSIITEYFGKIHKNKLGVLLEVFSILAM